MNLKCTWNSGKELLGSSYVGWHRSQHLPGWDKTTWTTPFLQSYQWWMERGLFWCCWCWMMLKQAWLINPQVKHTWQRGEALADLVKYQIKQQTSGTTANLSEDAELTQLLEKHMAFSHFLTSRESLPTIPFLECVWRFLPWAWMCLKVTSRSWEKNICPRLLVWVSSINLCHNFFCYLWYNWFNIASKIVDWTRLVVIATCTV